jgi:hypothetical protein
MKAMNMTGKQAALAGIFWMAIFLWYFEWAVWSWLVAIFFGVVGLIQWPAMKALFSERFPEKAPEVFDQDDPANNDDDQDFLSNGKILWQGSRRIQFVYDPRYRDTVREVTVHKVISLGRSNYETYLQGHCHLRNETRTFRLDRIKNRKVTDTTTGEFTHFRQMFGLPS